MSKPTPSDESATYIILPSRPVLRLLLPSHSNPIFPFFCSLFPRVLWTTPNRVLFIRSGNNNNDGAAGRALAILSSGLPTSNVAIAPFQQQNNMLHIAADEGGEGGGGGVATVATVATFHSTR